MALSFFGSHLASGRSSFGGDRLAFSKQASTPRSPAFRLPIIRAGDIGPGKKWEHYETNDNGKVVTFKIHVKKGDTVQCIAGVDKGKVGVVQKVLPKTGQLIVENINVKKKTVQPKREGETGMIVSTESPIHHSNVMAYSKEQNVRSRIGMKTVDGVKVRYLKKTGEVLP